MPIYGTAYTAEWTNSRTQTLNYFAGTLADDVGDDPFYPPERDGPGKWQRVQQVSWIGRGTGEA